MWLTIVSTVVFNGLHFMLESIIKKIPRPPPHVEVVVGINLAYSQRPFLCHSIADYCDLNHSSVLHIVYSESIFCFQTVSIRCVQHYFVRIAMRCRWELASCRSISSEQTYGRTALQAWSSNLGKRKNRMRSFIV